MHMGSWLRHGLMAAAIVAMPAAALAVDSPEEQAQRQALNAAQASFAAQQLADYETQKKAIADEQAAQEAAYRDALAARDAEVAAADKAHAEAQERWEAAVIACNAGDRSQCAQPVAP